MAEKEKVSLPFPCVLSRDRIDRIARNTRILGCTDKSGGQTASKLLGKQLAPARSPAPARACKSQAQLEICVHKCMRGNTML